VSFSGSSRACSLLQEGCTFLLGDAPRHGGFALNFPFRPHIARDLGAVGGLAGRLWGRWRCSRRWWRWTGTAPEYQGTQCNRSKNALPKTFHRMTREEGCTHLCDNGTPPESSRRGRRKITFVHFYRVFSRPGVTNLTIPTLPHPGVAGCCSPVHIAVHRSVPPPIRESATWPRSIR